MKKFAYKFKTYLYVIIILAALLSLAGLGFNAYRLIAHRYEGTNGLIGAILCVVIAAVILVLTGSILICARYEITKEHFTLRWGVLVTRAKISAINTLVYNTTTRVLAIVFDNDALMVISSVGNTALDIVDAIRQYNKGVIFQSISSESSPKNKNDKNKK